MKHQEHILAVSAEAFNQMPHGMTRMGLKEFAERFTKDLIVAQRAKLEKDPSYRQIIPYFMLFTENEQGAEVFPYRRRSGGEDRLKDRVSVGFGGHVDLADVHCDPDTNTINLPATVISAMSRELKEEVKIEGMEGDAQIYEIGVLIDNSDEVGRVHVGLVFGVRLVEGATLTANEEGIEILSSAKPAEIILAGYNLENWSSIVLGHLIKPVLEEKPAAEAAHAEMAE